MELGPRDDTVSLSTYNVITERAVLQKPILNWHVKRVYDGDAHGRSKYLRGGEGRENFCSFRFGVGNAIRRGWSLLEREILFSYIQVLLLCLRYYPDVFIAAAESCSSWEDGGITMRSTFCFGISCFVYSDMISRLINKYE